MGSEDTACIKQEKNGAMWKLCEEAIVQMTMQLLRAGAPDPSSDSTNEDIGLWFKTCVQMKNLPHTTRRF
jgi:hypothetical protein